MGAVENIGSFGDFVHAVHKHDAPFAEAFNNRPIVNNLVINIERRAEELQRSLQAFDGHVDAGAEPARIGENNLHSCVPPMNLSYRECAI